MKRRRFDGFGKLTFEEELVDGYPTVPYQPGALFFSFIWKGVKEGGGGGWVVNCLVVFPTHFNPNDSPLILLQISLLFMCTPVLKRHSELLK